jgi:signal transduction histidine kinase
MALTPSNQSRTLWWTVAAVVGLALLAFGAFWFVNSSSTGRALDEAESLRETDLALAAQDVAMKSIGQLVLIARDATIEAAAPADIGVAIAEVDRTVAEFGSRFEGLDRGLRADLTEEFEVWQAAAMQVTSLAQSGVPSEAADELVASMAPASEAFVAELTAARDSKAQAVEDSRDSVNSMARVAGFLTIFLIPVLAILAYRIAARRQLVAAAAHLDARIEAEKDVSKAKDQFIADVSTELRAPLASIYSFSETLLDKGFIDPQAGDLVGLINQQSAELARIVEDLMVAGHDEDSPLQLESEIIDMEAEIQDAADQFRKRGNAIGGTWGGGSVRGDPLRVRQILRNLITNAVEHGGPDIRIYGDAAGSRYVVSVEDNGRGVPADIADRLFTRFAHADGEEPAEASTGMGLVVASMLAEAMGGSLDYERVANRTSFVLSLPLAAGASPPVA